MMLKTHLVIALFVMLIVLQYIEYQIFFVLIFILATVLPDIDSGFSTIGKMKPYRIVNFLAKHRGILHSFSFCIIISVLFAFYLPIFALPFFMGYSVHLFVDAFTKEGIAPFWPWKKRTSWRITTGSMTETSVFAFFIVVDIIVLVILFA